MIANEITKDELKKMRKSEIVDLFAKQLEKENLQFAREHRFHPVRRWRFDFTASDKFLDQEAFDRFFKGVPDWAHPQKCIAIEIEGGIWTRGRHTRGSGFIKDCEKYNTATAMGWRVFRFPTDMVKSGEAIKFVSQEIFGK